MSSASAKQLADCANLARRFARENCWRDPETGETCAWYHGFWPYLRLLDYGSSPAIHKAFYLDGLVDYAGKPGPIRILVSGAADFSMLAVVLEALQSAKTPPRISVVDRCETPLMLCGWFAKESGYDVETMAADILDYSDSDGFDAIVTHSFLGSFNTEDRSKLARRWFELLRPGGKLLTINRLREQEPAGLVPFSTSQSATFLSRLSADLQQQRELLDCDPAEVIAMGKAYIERKQSVPVSSKSELIDLFVKAGFVMEHCEALEMTDPGKARPEGPTMPGGATYMKVIAARSHNAS